MRRIDSCSRNCRGVFSHGYSLLCNWEGGGLLSHWQWRCVVLTEALFIETIERHTVLYVQYVSSVCACVHTVQYKLMKEFDFPLAEF